MMNIISPLFNQIEFFFRDQALLSLTNQHKKILIIASIAFGFLAACCVLSRYWFKVEHCVTVTGRGAGSSLLKEPDHLYQVAKAMVDAVSVPVTAKLRSGFEDTSLFKENLLAAQESGIAFLTLHPRTKVDGYGPPARWDLIAEAKSILKIPVVGNGDILKVDDALRMLRETNCDALMIGRGSIMDPFIFQKIRARFASRTFIPRWEDLFTFYEIYLKEMPDEMPLKNKLGKVKQLMSFLFKASPQLLEHR